MESATLVSYGIRATGLPSLWAVHGDAFRQIRFGVRPFSSNLYYFDAVLLTMICDVHSCISSAVGSSTVAPLAKSVVPSRLGGALLGDRNTLDTLEILPHSFYSVRRFFWLTFLCWFWYSLNDNVFRTCAELIGLPRSTLLFTCFRKSTLVTRNFRLSHFRQQLEQPRHHPIPEVSPFPHSNPRLQVKIDVRKCNQYYITNAATFPIISSVVAVGEWNLEFTWHSRLTVFYVCLIYTVLNIYSA
jgi:hypothetical protein